MTGGGGVRPIQLAIAGTRGIPANYGGFETFAAELGRRLALRGHSVTVIGRRRWVGPSQDLGGGLQTRNLPCMPGKYMETVSAAAISTLVLKGFDVVLFCNAAAAPMLPLLRARTSRRHVKVAVNVDGIEWQRAKWHIAGRTWYHVGEAAAARFADVIVADAETVSTYWQRNFPQVRRVVIPYGSSLSEQADPEALGRYGVAAGEYCLYVSRFEPENNPELVLRSYLASSQPRRLVMLGRAAYDRRLQARVEALARQGGGRVLLPGPVYGDDYRSLQAGAAIYIQATQVGGTHPALVEAMSTGATILCLRTPENMEVLGGTGLLFADEAGLRQLLDDPQLPDRDRGRRAIERQQALYNWDGVTDAYERLLLELAAPLPVDSRSLPLPNARD
jgi:glycosyltransferase involved in cell wall biosynthesis